MTALREAWCSMLPDLKMLEPVDFSADQWRLLERLHANFNDREAHASLPIPLARFAGAATRAILGHAERLQDVVTARVEEDAADPPLEGMALYARLYNEDVDRLIGVLFPSARFRKGHYAYGNFTVPTPHGLHTDHSAEDASAQGEPICIARIGTLGTHYVTGDCASQDPQTREMLEALRYWNVGPHGDPEDILQQLLARGSIKTIPVDHLMLMVAGNGSCNAQVTQHIAARPPAGGRHSAFFQRQYKLHVTADAAPGQ